MIEEEDPVSLFFSSVFSLSSLAPSERLWQAVGEAQAEAAAGLRKKKRG